MRRERCKKNLPVTENSDDVVHNGERIHREEGRKQVDEEESEAVRDDCVLSRVGE